MGMTGRDNWRCECGNKPAPEDIFCSMCGINIVEYIENEKEVSEKKLKEQEDLEKKEAIEKEKKREKYIPPQWCKMSIFDHFDGMGGCWSVSCGYLKGKGIHQCKTCEYLDMDYFRLFEALEQGDNDRINELLDEYLGISVADKGPEPVEEEKEDAIEKSILKRAMDIDSDSDAMRDALVMCLQLLGMVRVDGIGNITIGDSLSKEAEAMIGRLRDDAPNEG
jgi:hypothetical protein